MQSFVYSCVPPTRRRAPPEAQKPDVWRQLLDTVFEINSAPSHATFGGTVVAGLSKIIEADVIVFHALDTRTQRILTQMSPPSPYTEKEISYYTAHPEQHPLGAYYAHHPDASARRISDVIDEKEWLASDYYRHCLQGLGLVYSVVLPVKVDVSIVAALSFCRRTPDFTREDCTLLDALSPHLRLAWQRHENPWNDLRERECRQRLQALGLSLREGEVLFWMTEGKLNREIATLLDLGLGTVQDHVSHILTKLQMENRHVATVFAIEHLHHQ